ncbi:MAG TPA: dethiobiotin synthase [Bryobacteraceae bacterium]|nr:dethiobiotin synthase [Bryobacteraceae bacterium]
MRGLFVTGTDTGVGKTVLSAALLGRYRDSAPLRYWKPVQTGIEQDDDTAEVRRLGAREEELCELGLRLANPVSPHLAAARAGIRISVDGLLAMLPPDKEESRWIVEGAGGALVPLNGSELMIDLMRALGLAVVVAARSGLGTINHTLLTLEALRARSQPVGGVVLVGKHNADNCAAIEKYGQTPVLGELPILQPLDAAALGAWARTGLDARGRLAEFLA